MKFISLVCCLWMCALCAGAAEIAITPASGQAYDSNGQRYSGSPISLLITLSAPATAAVPPSNTANIGIFTGSTFDNAARAVSNESIALVSGTSQKIWNYQATPTFDGTATMIIKLGTFGLGLPSRDFSYTLVLDRKPTVSIPAPGTSGNDLIFISTITSGLSGTEPAAFNSSFLSLSNGVLNGAPKQEGNVNTIAVTPYGYGSVTLTAAAGYVSDQYGNTNAETISTGTFNAPGGTTFVAPRVVSITGVSPGNLVYRTGQVIDLAVTFDRAVTLSGSPGIPYLRLNSTGSGSPAYAIYTGISGNNVLFSYTITDGHAAPILDLVDSAGLVLASQTALVGTAHAPDFVALISTPQPGSGNSLSKTTTYAINVDPPKPLPEEVTGATAPGSCGAGTGIAALLGVLAVLACRLRRPADGSSCP
jgi:hypothetical protein